MLRPVSPLTPASSEDVEADEVGDAEPAAGEDDQAPEEEAAAPPPPSPQVPRPQPRKRITVDEPAAAEHKNLMIKKPLGQMWSLVIQI